MKKFREAITFCALFAISSTIYGQIIDCENIPELNKKVVQYVKNNMNKTVDRGECWDVAAGALNTNNAKWDKSYEFGEKVDPETDCIFPGDIIQFKGVRLDYKKDGMNYWETMGHHTAVIYKVWAKGEYQIAAQNTKASGRKIGVSELKLTEVTKGKITFYRPTK